MAALELRLLGEFEARDGTGLPLTVSAKKNRALLTALALAPACSMSRTRLANLLWGARGEAQAQSSLRQALAALRRDFSAIDPSPLVAARDRIALDAKRVEIDVIAFERLAATQEVAALRRAASLYRGDLLNDAQVTDAAFDEWLALERGRLAGCAREVLEKLCARETGAERIRFAEQLVALDPLRETSHRVLMQVHSEAGNKALAARQYELCRAVLQDELRVAPDAQTEALYRHILRGRSPDESEPAAPAISAAPSHESSTARAVDDKPSVAVLPLAAINGGAELDGFCDGLTDDIVTGLSRVSAIRVISRNTLLTCKLRTVDVRTIGRELGAQYVIEGSVRSSKRTIRVSAQLTEAATGHHIWTLQVDRDRSELLDVQDDITKSIVASVQTQLILNEGRKSSTGATEASRLLARAWQRFLGLTEDSLAECGALARQALEQNHKSGMSNRLLAVTLYHQIYMGFIPWSQEAIDRLYLHAKAAIESDDADEYCHWAMCCAHLLRKEHALAIAAVRRGLKINPNCSLLHGSMGTILAWDGQHNRSIECNELALRINPQDPSNFYRYFGIALASYLARRYDEALVHAMDVVQTRPSWWLGQLIFCATLGQLGRYEEAARALKNAKRIPLNGSTLGILPFARNSDRQHLIGGLRNAGLNEAPRAVGPPRASGSRH
jgi:TolB-like protein